MLLHQLSSLYVRGFLTHTVALELSNSSSEVKDGLVGFLTSTSHSLVGLLSTPSLKHAKSSLKQSSSAQVPSLPGATFTPLPHLNLEPSSLVTAESGVFKSVNRGIPLLGPIVWPAVGTVRINRLKHHSEASRKRPITKAQKKGTCGFCGRKDGHNISSCPNRELNGQFCTAKHHLELLLSLGQLEGLPSKTRPKGPVVQDTLSSHTMQISLRWERDVPHAVIAIKRR